MLDIMPSKRELQKSTNTKSKARRKKVQTQTLEVNQPLEFITLVGPPKKARDDEESSRLVRTHAMRSYLDHKNLFTTIKPPLQNLKSQKEATGKFKLSFWSRKSPESKRSKRPEASINEKSPEEIARPPSPTLIHGDAGDIVITSPFLIQKDLGPFQILNLPLTSFTRRLLHYYHHDFTQNSVAVNPENNFFAFAVTDTALLHALLSMVAIHSYLSRPSDSVQNEIVLHQTKAVKDINARLKIYGTYLNDGLIIAVALLANCETLNGTYESSRMHMEGLKKMLALRGGLQCFYHNPTLQRILTWTDFAHSTTWNRKPLFPVISQLSGSLSQYEGLLRQDSHPRILDHGPLTLPSVSLEVFGIMHTLHLISAALKYTGEKVDRKHISNSVYTVEHRLLSLRYISADLNDTLGFEFSHLLLLAAHLYLHLAIRELPGTASMHLNMLTTLVALLPSDMSGMVLMESEISLSVLLWALFVGAAAASNHPARSALIQDLGFLSLALGLATKKEFTNALKGVLWLDRFCHKHCEKIWQEIESSVLRLIP